MNIIDFFKVEQKRLHDGFRSTVSDLSVEEWHYLAGGTSNSIAFIFWHSVRTEDNILRFILQGRSPLWNEENWYEHLHLPPRTQGTGMTTEEAQTFRIHDPALFMQYAERVWQEFAAYLDTIHDEGAELSMRIVKVKPLGEIPAISAIGQVCITHLWGHLGEITLLVGMQGKKGWPI